MDSERQREISSIGGRAAHAGGHAHRFTSEEARAAGRKGGSAISRDREHMATIGRRGGRSRSRASVLGTAPSEAVESASREP